MPESATTSLAHHNVVGGPRFSEGRKEFGIENGELRMTSDKVGIWFDEVTGIRIELRRAKGENDNEG